MESSLHDIVNGLSAARAYAENIADDIEHADPKAAANFRKFTKEVWDVWDRYRPLLPTNNDIRLLRGRPKSASHDQTNQ